MNLGENLRLAWEGLRASKMRAFLTMLGIIIGVAAVIVIMSLGNGMQVYINDMFAELGGIRYFDYLKERILDNGISKTGGDVRYFSAFFLSLFHF